MTRLSRNAPFPKRLMNAHEVADYIGTTHLNVYQMVSKRGIPFVKIGRSVRFDLHDIDPWIEGLKHGCAPNQIRT
jgi:excisionase family DNA binding protein